MFAPLATVAGLAEISLGMRQLVGCARAPAMVDLEPILRERMPTAGTNDERWREVTLETHSVLGWADSGMPVFDLTHSLAAALLLTDPSNVDAADVHLPFPTFVVRFPQPFWTVRGDMPVNLAIVHQHEAPQFMWTPEGRKLVGHKPRISTRLIGRDESFSVWEWRNIIPETGSIGEWLTEVASPKRGLLDDSSRHLLVAFRRLLVNLCLYVAESGRGERLGGKKPKASKPGKGGHLAEPEPEVLPPGPNVWVIGRQVKLDKRLVDAARHWTDNERAPSEGWKLASRFTVRGHRRRVVHGEGRALRTWQWILPYWKGEGPTFTHVYAPARAD